MSAVYWHTVDLFFIDMWYKESYAFLVFICQLPALSYLLIYYYIYMVQVHLHPTTVNMNIDLEEMVIIMVKCLVMFNFRVML